MKLHLLENRYIGGYVTFGSCWSKGETKGKSFRLVDTEGLDIPVQTKIGARWADGSTKWAIHTADSRRMGKSVEVLLALPQANDHTIQLAETEAGWHVEAGRITMDIPKAGGNALANNIRLDGFLRVGQILPVFELERRHNMEEGTDIHVRHCHTRVKNVDIEISGPLQCVVKFTGYYEIREELMPFLIRMSIGLNTDEVAFQHTFFYNGVEEKDFLKGMGLRFETPLKGPSYNHHVKFVTDSGVFHEMPTLMESRIPRTTADMKIAQLAGESLRFDEGTPEHQLAEAVASDVPLWNRHVLTQQTSTTYVLQKRTKPGCSMLDILSGRRAPGAVTVSGEDGGVMLSLRDFWQRFPSGLEVENLGNDTATCTIWFYSPQAKAMDFRHYDTRSYPYSNYEGFEEFGATAKGIAATSECRLCLINSFPEDDVLLGFCQRTQKPAVYVATPEVYHDKRAFGYWSLPCMDTPLERSLEEMLSQAVEYYKVQVDQRNWYGFFDYGDFMHSYDANRHCWKYDIGGCAWHNTELVPTYWLWLYFLRTGREDVYSMAEAMTRHCSETDVYHFGPLKGMGSRHNVRHWGCSCKEPRISMAGHHRPLLYLAGDHRIGDICDDVKDADESLSNLMHYYTKYDGEHVVTARTGPDWSAFVSDWMTAYERTLSEKHLNKIEEGIRSINEAPLRLGSGPAFAYDQNTGHMRYIGESNANVHLTLCMGAPQVWMEVADAIDSDLLRDMLDDYGALYLMTEEERIAKYGDLADKPFGMSYIAAALAAWSASRRGDAMLAERAWQSLLLASPRRYSEQGFNGKTYAITDAGEELKELTWISTGYVSQWCLNVIVTLDFIRTQQPSQEEALRLASTDAHVLK